MFLMARVLNKQMLLHRMVLTNPFLEDYFDCFTMKQSEKFIVIHVVPIEVSTQTIT